jgi:rhodanese-related sulfurtransferase
MNAIEKSKLDDSRVRFAPLSKLRASARSIPNDKELICVCQIGARSYDACRMLEGMGFRNVKFLEGGLRFWSETLGSES